MQWITILCFILQISYFKANKIYDESNSKDVFIQYKETFNRKYRDSNTEGRAYNNFINNLNSIRILNENAKDIDKLTGMKSYQMNMYADQNPTAILHKYGVTMKPYDYVPNLDAAEKMHNIHEKQKPIEDIKLFDLDHTEDYYKLFKETYNKTYKGPRTKLIHYYRFYKTLIELNNDKFNGQAVMLTSESDMLKHPHEYYFDLD